MMQAGTHSKLASSLLARSLNFEKGKKRIHDLSSYVKKEQNLKVPEKQSFSVVIIFSTNLHECIE